MFRYNNILNLFYFTSKGRIWYELDIENLKCTYNKVFNSLPDRTRTKNRTTCDIDNYLFIQFHTENKFLDKNIRYFNINYSFYIKKYGDIFSKDEISILFAFDYMGSSIPSSPSELIKRYNILFSKNVINHSVVCSDEMAEHYVKSYKKTMLLYKRREQINNIKNIINA
jgi:hypothetical protein